MRTRPCPNRPNASALDAHKLFEKNSIILLIGILLVVAIGGLVEIVPLFYLKSTIEEVDGVRPYTPLELAGLQHLRARGLLSLPFADDPAAARRGRALRPLLAGGRKHVRPSVPVGLEAQRPRSRARRRQIFRRLASRPSEQPARRSCRLDHAGLCLPGERRRSTIGHIAEHLATLGGSSAFPTPTR